METQLNKPGKELCDPSRMFKKCIYWFSSVSLKSLHCTICHADTCTVQTLTLTW